MYYVIRDSINVSFLDLYIIRNRMVKATTREKNKSRHAAVFRVSLFLGRTLASRTSILRRLELHGHIHFRSR